MKRSVPVFALVLLFCLLMPSLSGANNTIPRSYRLFSHLDINGDGVISENEDVALGSIRFLAMDADNNGHITLKEASSLNRGLASRHREFRGKRKGYSQAMEGTKHFFKEGLKARLKERGKEHFKEADRDKDGKITKKEFDDTRKRRFNTMDTSADNRVSLDEFIAFSKTHKRAMGRKDR